MSDDNNELISALVDDEHSDNTSIVNNLIKDQGLQDTWSRYHLIGDCLRGHLPDNISNQVSTQISKSLQNEPAILAPQKTKRFNIKPVVGFAIAASIAMIAVFGVQKGNEVNTLVPGPFVAGNEAKMIAPVPQSFNFPETQVLPAAVTQSDTPNSVANQRLNDYLMNHNEYRSNGSINGILPYVRIVTIESQE